MASPRAFVAASEAAKALTRSSEVASPTAAKAHGKAITASPAAVEAVKILAKSGEAALPLGAKAASPAASEAVTRSAPHPRRFHFAA
ncbi:hypothetical protein NL676_032690 [Syzygium grande]|nr:hypothetical protein NL676_032690 [Syzygium grande]